MEEEIKFPCIVDIDCKKDKDDPGCIITIPDLQIDVKGSNFVEAMALAVETTSAVYYYYRERNIPFAPKHSWEEVEKATRKNNKFPTHIIVM